MSNFSMEMILSVYNTAAHPLEILSNYGSEYTVTKVFNMLKSEDGVFEVLSEVLGDNLVSETLVKEKGYLLDENYRLTQSEFGLKTAGHQLDTLHFLIYLALLASSNYQYPKPEEGIKYINLYSFLEVMQSALPGTVISQLKGRDYFEQIQKLLFELYIPEEQVYFPTSEEIALFAEVYTKAQLFGEKEGEIVVGISNVADYYKKVLSFILAFVEEHLLNTKFMLSKTDASDLVHPCIQYGELFPLATTRCTQEDVITVLKAFRSALGKTIKGEYYLELFEEDNGTYTVVMDKKAVYKVTKEGVYREGQRVQCTVVKDHADYQLYDSFGSFIFFLMNFMPLLKTMKDGDIYKVGQWDTRYILGNLPMDAEAIMGMETTGIRPHYNRTCAQLYDFNVPYYLHITPEKVNSNSNEVEEGWYRINGEAPGSQGRVTRTSSNKYTTAARVLERFNLFLSSKSLTFMDNRYLAVRIVDLPEECRRDAVETILLGATGGFSLEAAIEKVFKYTVKDRKDLEMVMDILVKVFILRESEKDGKPTERDKLGKSTAPNILCKGKLTGFIPAMCLLDPDYTRDIELRTRAIMAPNLSANAGVSTVVDELGEEDYFMVECTIRDTIELYDEDKIDVCAVNNKHIKLEEHPSGKKTYHITSKCVYNIYDGVEMHNLKTYAGYDESGKFNEKLPLTGVRVLKDTPVLRVGYSLESQPGEIFYNTYKVPEEMVVRKVTIKKNEHGSLALVIKGVYAMNFAKPRGPAKIMPGFSVTGRHYCYNSLNKDLPDGVKLVISADCLKHRDKLQRELPYICATALENGFGHKLTEVRNAIGFTDEVLADFADMGILGNITPDVPFLPYDPMATAYKYYAELRKWFWERYGQSRWFYNRDVDGGLLNTLWLGLLDRSHTVVKETIDGKEYTLLSQNKVDKKTLKVELEKNDKGQVEYKLYKDQYWILRTLDELEELDPECKGRFRNGKRVEVITSCSSGDPTKLTKYDDVFVFYYTDHEHCPVAGWQRTWVAGPIVNEKGETEHVYLPNKPELTDFKVNCTKASLMMGVPLNVSCDNGLTTASMELASRLISNYREQIDKYSALMAMCNGQEIYKGNELVPTIKVFNGTADESEHSDEFLDYLFENEDNATFLEKVHTERKVSVKELYRHFNNVVLDLGVFRLYIPAVAEQDMMGTSAESTSGLLRDLMKDILLGAKLGEVRQRCRRMLSSIHTSIGHNMYEDIDNAEDEDYEPEYKSGMSILRKMTQGRKSLLAKIIGVPGLPFKNVIPYSELPGSTAQHYLDLCRKQGYSDEDIFGAELWITKDTDPRGLIHRCPLTSQDLVPNVLVRKGQYIFDFTDDEPGCINDLYMLMRHGVYLIYQQGKLIIIQFGDCDGDGLNTTIVDKDLVGYTEDCDSRHCERSIMLATGYNTWERAQGGYFMDQMIPKKVELSTYIDGVSLSAKNISLFNCSLVKGDDGYVKVDEINHPKSWSALAGLTCVTKEHHVGKAYTLKLWAEGVISTVNSLDLPHSKELANWTHLVKMLKAISELYEGNPLGGYSPEGHKVMTYLAEAMTGASFFKLDFTLKVQDGVASGNRQSDDRYNTFYEYVNALIEKGLNANYAFQYICLARSYSRVVKTIKKMGAMALDEMVEAAKDIKIGDFIYYISLAWFRATKGQLNLGSKGMRNQNLALMIIFLSYPIDHKEWGEKSLIIKWLNYAVPALLKSQVYPQKGWVIENLFDGDASIKLSPDSFVGLD